MHLMKLRLQCIDNETKAGVNVEQDDIAELIEMAINDLQPFSMVLDGKIVEVKLVNVEISPILMEVE